MMFLIERCFLCMYEYAEPRQNQLNFLLVAPSMLQMIHSRCLFKFSQFIPECRLSQNKKQNVPEVF